LSKEVLDFRGEPCPGPLIKTIRKLADALNGVLIEVLTDIEECVKAISETLELLEVKNISVERVNNYWRIRIEK